LTKRESQVQLRTKGKRLSHSAAFKSGYIGV